MAGINTVGGLPSLLNPGSPDVESQDARLNLTREQFFKIMITELQTQDPLEPMDQQQFLGQLAQLESLNSQSKMTKGIEDLSASLRFGHLNDASSMLGKVLSGTVRQQALDSNGVPQLDVDNQPVYTDVPVEGLAQRVVTDGNNTSIVLLVPVIGDDGEFVTDPQGGILTREITVGVGTVTQILDPLVGADAVGVPGQ
jgi:flagellar basal-body rod modification protein FlgD